ncbi:MAG: bifunctional folylpolyglutamate synthase/dihydrofolate synthase [Pelagibacteraceae bacterium]|jgi:dihydrofolate synthase/folylpolyglutamate synthase|nr:bifunctional folylpolyglutamate synthase/dihydrofolate synthase [Pelagibacteraceae bacterium]MDP6710143.1 bifunctional folylpolyglutamate synthase/dihydrofolate synthase [Pelagibacteraceae bacterium]|tara:strand:+ start:185 stop:1465 length:1281 start_codon:yes stop_codon:yes gene_type:complete
MKIRKILKRLLQLHPKSIDLSLDRIKRLLKDLNNPEKKINNAIQVVGTNGKHSLCVTLREIFETAGYTVNLNTSPSLRKFNERYFLSGKYISDEKLLDLLTEVEKINQGKSITYHEFICACFFLAASRTNSDVNILESGLFFRLDASNVLEKNICSVVMPIGIDHKDFLKEGTIDEVVYEKCSHLLNGSKIVISEQINGVIEKIKKNISTNTSKKIIHGEHYNYQKNTEGFIYNDKIGSMNLGHPNLLGDFQLSNISTAIATIRNLDQFKVSKSHIAKAITKIRCEGRLQNITQGKLRKYVSKNNQIIIDGAHNVLAALAIRKYLDALDKKKKIFMVLGMMINKEHKKFIQIFKDKVHSIIALDIPNQVNFVKKEKLSEIALSCGIPSKIENSIETAIKNIAKEDDNAIIFCTGSLYFSGEILNLN